MNNIFGKVLIGIIAFGIGHQGHAFVYSFNNNTDKTIAIGMRYRGINEPLEQRTIAPNSTAQFKPGDPDISAAKIGFRMKELFYLIDPAQYLKGQKFTQRNINTMPWKKVDLGEIPNSLKLIEYNNVRTDISQDKTTGSLIFKMERLNL